MRSKAIFLFTCSVLFFGSLRAQSLTPTVIASDGGFFTSVQGSISWTLGEPISETYTATNNILTQGFHQPFGMIVSGIPGSFTFGPLVYPNPTSGVVFINMGKMPTGNYDVEIFDALGKKITGTVAVGADQRPIAFNLSDLANGIYLMKISSSSFYQSYRIVKTK